MYIVYSLWGTQEALNNKRYADHEFKVKNDINKEITKNYREYSNFIAFRLFQMYVMYPFL